MTTVSCVVASLENNTPLIKLLNQLDHEVIVTSRLGKPRCRNLAAFHSSGDLLIFFDGDTMLSWEHLHFIIQWLREHPDSCLSAKSMFYVCTRVLAISRANFFRLKGFNEFFEELMDEDFGVRLLQSNIPLYHLPLHWLKHNPTNDPPYIHKIRRPSELMKFLLCYPHEVWASYLLHFGLKRGFMKFLARRFIRTTHILEIPFMLGRNIILFLYHALTLPFRKTFTSFDWWRPVDITP